MQEMLKEALNRNFDNGAKVLAEAASIVRKDIFDHSCPQIKSSFDTSCQIESVPAILKSLVSLVLFGNSMNKHDSQFT